MFKFFKKKPTFPNRPITIDEYIQIRLGNGDKLEQIQKDLLEDLGKGGVIFKGLKEFITPTFPGSTNRFEPTDKIMGESGLYVWSVVFVDTCPDCLARHGKTATWKEWEKQGLPRTGKTRCGKECKCVLLPKEAMALKPFYQGNDLNNKGQNTP